jgi:signal transduction histidine kinase
LKEYLKIWQKQSGGVGGISLIDGGKAVIAQEAEQSLFRVIQESLSNISRHSRATAASIFLTFYEDHLTLQSATMASVLIKRPSNMGLDCSPWKKVKELGGTLKMNSTASGTTITIMVPRADGRSRMATNEKDQRDVGG